MMLLSDSVTEMAASVPTSDIVSATTAIGVPGPVNTLQVSQRGGSTGIELRVNWAPPTANNCPVDSYIITHALTRIKECADDISPRFQSQTVNSQITSISLDNLKANSEYFVSAIAGNSAGTSDVVSKSSITVKTVPSFVPTVSVSESDITATSIRFTWNKYSCEELNGRFRYYSCKLTNLETGIPKTYTLISESSWASNLTPCTRYSFEVAVKNEIGVGPYSNASEVETSPSIPNRVQDLAANAVEGYPTVLSLHWNKPSSSCPIDNYTISYELLDKYQCGTVSTTFRNTSGTTMDTMYNSTGLLPYSSYNVYVTASTAAGEGESSVTRTQTSEAAPSEPPRDVSKDLAIKRSLSFTWQIPPCHGRRGIITGYSYKLKNLDRDEETITGDTDTSYIEIGSLVPYTLYSFQVLARTVAGDGPYSDAIQTRTAEAKPSRVTVVRIPSGDATSITVQWQPPDPPQGIIIAYYVLYFKVTQEGDSSEMETVTDGLDQEILQLELTGLESDANFSIQVQAETAVGKGPLSAPVYRITQEGRPGPPSSVMIVSKKETELEIVWGVPMEPNGRIISYTVRYRAIHKPYNLNFIPSEFTSLPVPNPDVYKRVLLGLEPSTQYEIKVLAETGKGEGSSVSVTGYTEPKSDIPPPVKPTFDPDRSTGTLIVVSIPAVDNPYVTSYMVWMKKLSSRRRRESGPNEQGEAMGTFDENPDSYIAADVNKTDHTGDFAVGDNKTYNGYYNPPLQEGAKYEIRSGASSKTDDASTMSWSSPLTVTAGEYDEPGVVDPTGSSGFSGTGSIVAIIGVLMLFAATGFVAMFIIKRRRAQQTAQPFDSVRMKQIDKVAPRYIPAPKYIPAPTSATTLKTVGSEDALANLNNEVIVIGATTPADIPKKPHVKMSDKTPPPSSSGPIKVEYLKEYVKNKKAKNNEGFKQDYGSLPDGQVHSWELARKEENKVKNRYANIIAYDHSRVILDKLDGDPDSDYINACYIDGYNHPNKYIASQGPNTASTRDMWRMIWQEKTSMIVMVTHLVEGGKKKCEQYWPSASKLYGRIEVSLESETKLADYATRNFTLKKEGETRTLKQFHFTSWPDMGLPKYVSPLLNFVNIVKASVTPKMGPIVVHCSAGIGRTGTFITLDSMLDQAKAEGNVDVLKFVTNMRDRRIKMVQTQDQYIFIFDALLEAFLCGQTWIRVEDIRKEYDRMKLPSPNGSSSMLQDEFSKLTILQPVVKGDRFRGGKDPLNVDKNRFPNNLPLDRSRPYLMTMGSEHSTNYINASFINGYWKRDQYITTQLPMPNTSTDFWSMIYDYNSPAIVMLNPVDPNDQTMDQYWPEKSLSAFGPFTVQLLSVEIDDGILCRTFTMDNMNKPKDKAHTVRQFEFQGWPLDDDVPTSPVFLLKLINCLERYQGESPTGPLTVQCIDGVRCCGVFCAILTMLDKMKAEKVIDVFQAVKTVRNNRPMMVATLDQYKFCYETAQNHMESFDIYANFR